MSDAKQPEKDIDLKDLNKETLNRQIEIAQQLVQEYQTQIVKLQNDIQQQIGVAGFANHLLTKFKIADKPKEDPKKTPLEVK